MKNNINHQTETVNRPITETVYQRKYKHTSMTVHFMAATFY